MTKIRPFYVNYVNIMCGQLKVAPEHISNEVLSKLGKPSVEVYNRFVSAFKRMNQKLNKEQYLVPIFNVFSSRFNIERSS